MEGWREEERKYGRVDGGRDEGEMDTEKGQMEG